MAGLVPFNRKYLASTADFYDMIEDFFNIGWPARRDLTHDTFKLDVEENESDFCITAELPGILKEEVALDLTEGKLTICVRREENVNEEKKNYIHKERRLSAMSRSVYLSDAEADGIKARLENGVLNIIVPKKEKTQRSRKIEID